MKHLCPGRHLTWFLPPQVVSRLGMDRQHLKEQMTKLQAGRVILPVNCDGGGGGGFVCVCVCVFGFIWLRLNYLDSGYECGSVDRCAWKYVRVCSC